MFVRLLLITSQAGSTGTFIAYAQLAPAASVPQAPAPALALLLLMCLVSALLLLKLPVSYFQPT
jgi:hypothetical protein